jgi:hypothetical protein
VTDLGPYGYQRSMVFLIKGIYRKVGFRMVIYLEFWERPDGWIYGHVSRQALFPVWIGSHIGRSM